MKNRTRKWLFFAGCLVICAVMAALIGSRFTEGPKPDDQLLILDIPAGGATVSAEVKPGGATANAGAEPGGAAAKDDAIPIVVKPDTPIQSERSSVIGDGAVFTGSEQTIQPHATKPQYDEETLKDPTKTPDGTLLSEPPRHVDHDTVTTPPAEGKPSGNGGKNGNGGGSAGGLPGFENVPNAGENKVVSADDMYENGNKIGIMK